METKVKGYRFNEITLKQLKEISETINEDETSIIKKLINKEYKKIKEIGKEELKQKNEILKEIIENLVEIYK